MKATEYFYFSSKKEAYVFTVSSYNFLHTHRYLQIADQSFENQIFTWKTNKQTLVQGQL